MKLIYVSNFLGLLYRAVCVYACYGICRKKVMFVLYHNTWYNKRLLKMFVSKSKTHQSVKVATKQLIL